MNRVSAETEAARADGARKRRSLAGIAGSWKPDPEFDRVIEEQRQIDWSPDFSQ